MRLRRPSWPICAWLGFIPTSARIFPTPILASLAHVALHPNLSQNFPKPIWASSGFIPSWTQDFQKVSWPIWPCWALAPLLLKKFPRGLLACLGPLGFFFFFFFCGGGPKKKWAACPSRDTPPPQVNPEALGLSQSSKWIK